MSETATESWLRLARKRAGLTVAAVSRATGFSRQTVTAAENGSASLSTVAALARFYDSKPAMALGDTHESLPQEGEQKEENLC